MRLYFPQEKVGGLGGRRKKRRQESVCSVDVDPGYLENRTRKEAEREAQVRMERKII